MNINWKKKIGWNKFIFSLEEVRDLIIAVLIIGFLFSATHEFFVYTTTASIFFNFITASIIFSLVVIVYELATKYFAYRYNCNAEFILWPIGSIFSIILTLLTQFIFAVVGTLKITTKHATRLGYRFIGLTNEELGKIAISGPLFNIIFGLFGFLIVLINQSELIKVLIDMNLIFALFNLIPIPPLNGARVFGWSRIVWVGLFSATLVLLFLPAYIGIGYTILLSFILMIVIFFISRIVSPWTPPKELHKF